MAGKYTKQGVFPIILDGSETVSGTGLTWGEDTGKVGLIKFTSDGGSLTFDSENFPADNSGDSVYVVSLGTVNVNFTPDPFSAGSEDDQLSINAGGCIWVTYHHDHGWMPMSKVTLT